jgi:site-specific recombinase XerC
LIRTPRTLPNVVEPGEVDAFIGPMRRWRDRAMVEAMLLGGLRHCEVLGFGSKSFVLASVGCSSSKARAASSWSECDRRT